MNNSSIAPFVKWAGGKRQLLPQIKERMPEQYNNYFEPFIGGGAVLFGLLPTKALINDINKALINTYRQIRNIPEEFLSAVKKLDEKIIKKLHENSILVNCWTVNAKEDGEALVEMGIDFITTNILE